jgi:disulfide bond formation protein DsbB
MALNSESAAAAVETLRSELEVVNGALASIDQKAAFLPAALGAIVGIFIAPDAAFTHREEPLLLVALVTGISSALTALWVLWARFMNVGPNARETLGGMHLDPADFNRAVAGSLANAVDQASELAKWKGVRLNAAMWLAAATILILATTRLL